MEAGHFVGLSTSLTEPPNGIDTRGALIETGLVATSLRDGAFPRRQANPQVVNKAKESHHRGKSWLVLIEVVTSAGAVDRKRRKLLQDIFVDP